MIFDVNFRLPAATPSSRFTIKQPVPGADGQIHLDIVVTEVENQMVTSQVLL